MRHFFLFFIKGYQLIAHFIKPSCCRFTPTCSEYAYQAFLLHGIKKGAILTIKRILKCRPGGSWGYDPVPSFIMKRKKQ